MAADDYDHHLGKNNILYIQYAQLEEYLGLGSSGY